MKNKNFILLIIFAFIAFCTNCKAATLASGKEFNQKADKGRYIVVFGKWDTYKKNLAELDDPITSFENSGIDVSETGDGSVKAFSNYDENYCKSILYILTKDSTLKFNEDSSGMFKNFSFYVGKYEETRNGVKSSCNTGIFVDTSIVDTSNIENASEMFAETTFSDSEYTSPTNIVVPMSYNFSKTLNLNWLNANSLEDASNMFKNTNASNIVLNNNMANLKNTKGMFSRTGKDNNPKNDMTIKNTNGGVYQFDLTNVTDASHMFENNNIIKSVDLTRTKSSNVQKDYSYMFSGCTNLSNVNFESDKFISDKVTNMSYMFKDCEKLTNLDFSNALGSNVTNMSYMFSGCTGLKTLKLNLNTDYLNNISYMFHDCTSLTTLELGERFTLENFLDFSNMFTGLSAIETLDLSYLDTSNATHMSGMFSGCSHLTNITFGEKFKTDNVWYMNNMFKDCSYLNSSTLDLSKFNTKEVLNFDGMFNGCNGTDFTELDLSSFSSDEVKSANEMFKDCSHLKTIYVNKDFDLSKKDKKIIIDKSEILNFNDMFVGLPTIFSGKLEGKSNFNTTNKMLDNTYAKPYTSEESPGFFTLKENTSDEIIIGDYVVDGKFNIQDLLALRDALASGKTFTTDELQRINVDGIPGFTINDLISLMVRFANTL